MIKDRASAQMLQDKAIAAFIQQTALNMKINDVVHMEGNELTCQALLDKQLLDLVIKPSVTSQNLNAIIYEITQRSNNKSLTLVTDYINPSLAEKLKDAGIEYMDTAGNCFLNRRPLLVFIKGNKPVEKSARVPPGRAFQYNGLKVILAFLQTPELIAASYRDIAEQAKVSLGSVGGILSDLADQGFIQTTGSRRTIVNKERLLQRWVEHYPLLKQKHLLLVLTTDDHAWWQHIKPNEFKAVWGGEIAGQLYTDYLQAKDGVVYLSAEKTGEFIKATRLRKRKTEDVDSICIELIDPFWTVTSLEEQKPLAPALVVYADLIHSKEARNLETAKRLYEQWLS